MHHDEHECAHEPEVFRPGIVADTRDERLTDEWWAAILHNDAAYNDRFFYAVKTTKIFCRPSCKSRPPKKENVRIFHAATEALAENFRPCKRCKPTGQRLPDNEWVTTITEYIDAHYQQDLTLTTLADVCHGSPYHLHRTFKRVKGITPVEYVQQRRIGKAIEYLTETKRTVAEIAGAVGIANTPYFITVFKKLTGRTPNEFRQLQGKSDD